MNRVARAGSGLVLLVALAVLAVAQTGQPPQITFIDFPGTIQADSKPVAGLVGFTDPDGDVNEVAFEVVQGEAGAIEIQPGSKFDPKVKGQSQGIIGFALAAKKAQRATLRVTLSDERGNRSQPKEFSFEAKGVEPPPRLQVNPTSLSFLGQVRGPDPASQTLTITNAGGGQLSWTAVAADASWLKLSRTSGGPIGLNASESVTVTATSGSLGLGQYQGRIIITAQGAQNSPVTIPVSLTLETQPAVLQVSTSSLSFQAQVGAPNPTAQILIIGNIGGGTLNWSAVSDASWLNLSPNSGAIGPRNSVQISASVDPRDLPVGIHQARITITAPGAVNSPQIVRVTFTLIPRRSSAPGGQLFVSSNGASFPGSGKGEITRIDLNTFLTSFATLKATVVRDLDTPEDGACGPDGMVYFVDRGGTGKVIRFDKNGKGLQVVAEISRPEGLAFDANSDLFVSAESGIYLIPGGRPISRPQQVISYKFDLVGGLAFLTQGTYQGDLVAVEEGKDVVVRFPRNAASSSFGGPVTFAKTGLDHPIGIAINSSGDVFVANFESSTILQFGPEGTSKGRLGASVDLRLFRPIHIEFDGADNLFIAEWGDLAGDGFVAMVTPSSQLRFLGSFVDAWGVALCPSE